MPTKPIDPAVHDRARRMRSAGMRVKDIAAALGISAGAVSESTQGIGRVAPSSPAVSPGPAFRENADGTATATAITDSIVRTYDDAVRAAGVDLTVWYVDSWECTQWTTAVKLGGAVDRVEQIQQYRVHLRLRRIMRRAIHDAIRAVFDSLPARSWPKPPAAGGAAAREKHLAVFCLFDAHFGKLCWGPETGSNYDLKIAEAVYRNAVRGLLADSSHRRIGRMLLPVGNDFFHVDNAKNTTAAGTPQDVDGRYQKVFEAGFRAVIDAVETMAAVAPVDVVWVPGNHDPTVSWHLVKTVEAWFRGSGRVTVDAGPSPRKYVWYANTLIGLTHGDREQHRQLPSLMAAERPDEWAKASCREWLVGHMHRSRQWVTQPVDTFDGTTVRALRSLAGTDAWHHGKGYVHGPRGPAAEVYWYGEKSGYCGHNVRAASAE